MMISPGTVAMLAGMDMPSSLRKDEMMRKTLFANPRAKRGRPGAAWLFWTTLATLAVLLGSDSVGLARAQVIQWKFKPGEVLRYALEQKAVESIKEGGRETKSTRSDITNLSWTVKNVASNGEAEITHRIERVRLRIEAPPYMPFDFDSDTPKVDAPGPFEAVAQLTKAMAGVEFTFKMKPTGEIIDIVITAQTVKRLRDAVKPPDGAGAGAGESPLSEQAIKDMLMQLSPPPFPAGALEPGKTWSSKPSKIPTPVGNMVMDKIFTFQGADAKNPNLLVIGMETRVALEPIPNSPVTAKIRTQEGKGTLTFDADAGRIVNTRGTEKSEMLISEGGRDIGRTTDSTTSMTLQP
jgi:hypothetical protein